MPSLRVTQGLMVQRMLTNLGRQTRRILDLQEEMSTGLRVNAPSDDPVAARLGIDTRTAMGKAEQYLAGIRAAGPQLEEATTAVQTSIKYLGRANDLALQGANGTYSQAQLDNIAEEVNQLIEGLVNTANHQTNGRYIFAGTRTNTPAFTVTRNAAGEITDVTYAGNSERVQVGVADGVRVSINEPGSQVFQADQDVFQVLIDIRDNLRAGNKTALQTARLDEIKAGREQMLQSLARIGAVQNRLEQLDEDTENFLSESKKLLSNTIEADYAETLVNLNAHANAYQAALNSAARVLQPSLLDFVS